MTPPQAPEVRLESFPVEKVKSDRPVTDDDDEITGDYSEVEFPEDLENQPLNHRYFSGAMWALLVCQFVLAIVAMSTCWSKGRLLNLSNDSIIMELETTDMGSNIEMYSDAGYYELVSFTYIFCIFFPILRCFLLCLSTYTHVKYLDSHADWPVKSAAQAEHIVAQGREHDLMPWWNGVSVMKDGFRTKESQMKMGSIAVDILVICTKFMFTRVTVNALLNSFMTVSFELELGDTGELVDAEINSKSFFGSISYGLSLILAFTMIGLLIVQKNSWLRCYKERALSMLNSDNGGTKRTDISLDESGFTGSLTESLLPSPTVDDTGDALNDDYVEPTFKDKQLAFIWFVSFCCWVAIVAGVDIAKVKYSGKWNEGMDFDEQSISFYELTSDLYNENYKSHELYRCLAVAEWVLLGIVIPTMFLFLMGYLVLSKFSKKIYNEHTYCMVFRLIKVMDALSGHLPLLIGLLFMTIEVERITDPLLNTSELCKEEKCVTIKGMITPGIACVLWGTLTMTVLYKLLINNYNHKTYKL